MGVKDVTVSFDPDTTGAMPMETTSGDQFVALPNLIVLLPPWLNGMVTFTGEAGDVHEVPDRDTVIGVPPLTVTC